MNSRQHLIISAVIWIVYCVVIAVVFLGHCSRAGADEWSKQDIAMEATWEVLHVIDWGQTRDIAKHPEQYCELNPILGRHPSVERVDWYMAGSAIVHPIIAGLLPSNAVVFGVEFSPRTIWQAVSIGVTGGCVVNNFSIGLSINY